MKNIQYYAFPTSLKELSSVLFDKKRNSIVVSGWTLLSKTLPQGIETIVDLKNLPLRCIKIRNKDLIIGALATFDDIDNSQITQKWAGGILSDVASKCSSQLIRNMATIGGNIAKLHSFNLFPGVLLALDAKIKVLTKTGMKTFEISDIYKNDFKCSFGRDSIITDIIIPSKTKNWKTCFEKIAKTHSSWESYANITYAVEMKNKKILNFRFIVSALLPKPIRFESVEKIICGSSVSGREIEESINCLKQELDKIPLTGRIANYKKEVVLAVFRRFMQTKLKIYEKK